MDFCKKGVLDWNAVKPEIFILIWLHNFLHNSNQNCAYGQNVSWLGEELSQSILDFIVNPHDI
jgi:hypothetical protein